MYAEVGGSWGTGVVVWVLDEAFCRTDGGLCVKAFVMLRLNTIGVLGLAGKIEKTGMMVDLSIVLVMIALKPENSGTKSIGGEDSRMPIAPLEIAKTTNQRGYICFVSCACCESIFPNPIWSNWWFYWALIIYI